MFASKLKDIECLQEITVSTSSGDMSLKDSKFNKSKNGDFYISSVKNGCNEFYILTPANDFKKNIVIRVFPDEA